MPDLALRRAALQELLDAHHDRMSVMDDVARRVDQGSVVGMVMLGLASWNAQALACLIQIELDRISSLEGESG
jgi:hypothetical protein